MRRVKKWGSIALTAVMVLSMTAYGEAGSAAEAEETVTVQEGSEEQNNIVAGFDKAANEMNIALVLNANLGDHAMNDLSYEGIQSAADKYGFNFNVVELGNDATLQVPTLQELSEDPECDLIVCAMNNLREAVQQVAQEYPEQKFILYDAQDELRLPNVFSMEHGQNEGAYLAGVAAALLTTSDAELANDDKTVGFVGGGENTALDDYLVGYIQGVHSVDEDINILVSWIGDFKDTAKGKELAIAQANQGADVIFSVAGGAGLGILAGCAESDVYSIGVDSDQYTVLLPTDPETAANICTSMYKKTDITVDTLIGQALDGTLEWGGYVKLGLAEGVVGLAVDNENFTSIFSAEHQAYIQEVQEAATNGELEILSAIGMDNEQLQEILATATK